MNKSIDQVHRVVHLPVGLLEGLRRNRDATGQTNAQVVGEAVSGQLPKVVEALKAVGLDRLTGKRQPVRLPFSAEAGTLEALKQASDSLGIPAIQLLCLCLLRSVEQPRKPKTKRGGRRRKQASTRGKS
jgi:hypothetical protein